MKRTIVIVLAAAVAGGLAGAMIGLAIGGGASSSTTTQSAAAPPLPIASTRPARRRGLTPEQIYRTDAPGVVVITDTRTQSVAPSFFSPGGQEQVGALGSGFVVDKQGDIVTNDHVVQGSSKIRVGFSSGASYPAEIVGADPSTDVAVVRVHAPSSVLAPLTFDDSANVQVGDSVYAIGNPFGLDRTMTGGIVSATGRDIESPNGLTIPKAIQTDAPINHGNSGGPLLDTSGRVVGVNAQIQGGTVNVGIGFAIPSDTAKSVAEQLIANGHAEHAWLGVQVATIDPNLTGVVRGLPSHGVIVAKVVKGSPAAKSGLVAARYRVAANGADVPAGGDAIVAVDGKSVETSAQLADAVAAHKPGDKLTLDVVRNGAHRTVEVTLGNVPEQT
jgi:S1-C subfamily serine protease